MNVYMVWVRDGLQHRYIDSMWASEEHAVERVADLERAMKAGCFGGGAWIVEGRMVDARIETARAVAKGQGSSRESRYRGSGRSRGEDRCAILCT